MTRCTFWQFVSALVDKALGVIFYPQQLLDEIAFDREMWRDRAEQATRLDKEQP